MTKLGAWVWNVRCDYDMNYRENLCIRSRDTGERKYFGLYIKCPYFRVDSNDT